MRMIERLRIALCVFLSVLVPFAPVWAADVPEVGQMAPDFVLPDQNGNQVSLSSLRGRWLVLYFYPKNDTPGCTEEACNFRDDMATLTSMGAQIVGVTVDDTDSNARFAKKYYLPFPLLADKDGAVAERYGALSDWLVARFARRYTFLIDPQGKIAKSYLDVDTSKHSAEIIDDLKLLTSFSGK
jgi:peroxiredoxin Q/BCP